MRTTWGKGVLVHKAASAVPAHREHWVRTDMIPMAGGELGREEIEKES